MYPSTATIVIFVLLGLGWLAMVGCILAFFAVAKRADAVLEQVHDGEPPEGA